MEAGLAALAFWGFVAVIVVAGIWDGIRKREAQHETLRRLLDAGQPVDEGLVRDLLDNRDRRSVDLRVFGLIVVSAGVGLGLLGWLVSLEEAGWLWPMLGVGALVGCVGLGLMAAARFQDHRGLGAG